MINRKVFFTIVLFSVILQSTVLNSLSLWGVKPDLILIGVIFGALYFEFRWALFFGILLGVLKDAVGVHGISLYAVILPSWVFLIRYASKKISLDLGFIPVIITAVISILNSIIFRVLFIYIKNSSIPAGIFLRIAVLESLYTASLFLLLLKVFGKQLI